MSLTIQEMDDLSNWEEDDESEELFEVANWESNFDEDSPTTTSLQPPQNPPQQEPPNLEQQAPELPDTPPQE